LKVERKDEEFNAEVTEDAEDTEKKKKEAGKNRGKTGKERADLETGNYKEDLYDE
jgi:hypothetical protein